ncbi:GNAT family N-acetyltransferase [Lacticaseibacillus absianus]|uniref:GNAT family N-acetyltransferase n=1 Tax=Lacticaseibacillus absianus TaxID=2729623 RepID=UPI0015C8A2B4|nr:GNAT family protein [Lacticaseibacillus absianus]
MQTLAHKPTLQTEDGRIRLRPFAAADIPVMLTILTQPLVNLYTGALDHWPAADEQCPLSDAERQRTIAWYQTRNAQPDRLDLAIEAAGQLVGEVVLNAYDAEAARCNLRILIADDATDQGIGTSTFRLLLPYAFAQLELRELTLDAFAFNPRAVHVYHRAGFVDTGVLPAELIVDGRPIDSIEMHLTAEMFTHERNV